MGSVILGLIQKGKGLIQADIFFVQVLQVWVVTLLVKVKKYHGEICFEKKRLLGLLAQATGRCQVPKARAKQPLPRPPANLEGR